MMQCFLFQPSCLSDRYMHFSRKNLLHWRGHCDGTVKHTPTKACGPAAVLEQEFGHFYSYQFNGARVHLPV
uniref:Uncharacterized protein n=1 Tax=Anguilla anguilla TaxID=7936 RepID=A0A0E9XG27_ANGAN